MDSVTEQIDSEAGKLFETAEGELFSCGGNACDVIAQRQVNVPGTMMIAQFYCRNNSQRPVNVTFKWVNIMGGTGVVSRAKVPAQQEVSFDLQNLSILGYYSSAASYA